MGRKFNRQFKIKVVIEALQGGCNTKQVAVKYQLHPNLVAKWKREFLKGGAMSLFAKDKSTDRLTEEFIKKEARLCQKIGQISGQLSWLKTKIEEALTKDERLALIEKQGGAVPLAVQAQLLSIDQTMLCARSRIKEGSYLKYRTAFRPNLIENKSS